MNNILMRSFAFIFILFSFLVNSTGLACGLEKVTSHCDEEITTSLDLEKKHDSSNEEGESHSSDSCDCQCHGHICKVLNFTSEGLSYNVEAIGSEVIALSRNLKIENYHSKIIRPPIS